MSSSLSYAAGKVATPFFSYLHLWKWLEQRLHPFAAKRPRRTFDSVEGFWRAAFNDEFAPGDPVALSDSFISEWVPRVPGSAWAHPYERESLDEMRTGHFGGTFIGIPEADNP